MISLAWVPGSAGDAEDAKLAVELEEPAPSLRQMLGPFDASQRR